MFRGFLIPNLSQPERHSPKNNRRRNVLQFQLGKRTLHGSKRRVLERSYLRPVGSQDAGDAGPAWATGPVSGAAEISAVPTGTQ